MSGERILSLPVPPDLSPLARPDSGKLLAATSDREAVTAWLAKVSAAGSRKTMESYRKESERFLMWLIHHQLSLKTFGVEAASAYVRFLSDPHPDWVGPRHHRAHPAWRPFSGALSPSSIRQARLILGSLYAFLAESGYTKGNPFRLLGRVKTPKRRIHELVVYKPEREAVERSLAAMPRESERERLHFHRCRWAFFLITLTGLRRAEAANGKMGDIWHRVIDGEDEWTITVSGKGEKIRDVPIPDKLLDELKVYRAAIGLHPLLPISGESTPLIMPVIKTGRSTLSEKAVYLLVRQIFLNASFMARDEGNHDLANRLEKVSTHWLRHTSATLQIEAAIPLEMVQENLGHADIQTTREYVHVNPSGRYRAAKKLVAT